MESVPSREGSAAPPVPAFRSGVRSLFGLGLRRGLYRLLGTVVIAACTKALCIWRAITVNGMGASAIPLRRRGFWDPYPHGQGIRTFSYAGGFHHPRVAWLPEGWRLFGALAFSHGPSCNVRAPSH